VNLRPGTQFYEREFNASIYERKVRPHIIAIERKSLVEITACKINECGEPIDCVHHSFAYPSRFLNPLVRVGKISVALSKEAN